MGKLEFFVHAPAFTKDSFLWNVGWVRIELKENGRSLHELWFAVRIGGTFYSWMLIPYMEKLTTMFMSTTRGLKA